MEAPPSALGSMMASGRAGTTASRSASMRPLARPLTRTMRRGRPCLVASPRKPAAEMRAASLRSGEIESSRSTMSASAPQPSALSSLAGASAGTNSSERMSGRPHADEGAAVAFGHQLVVLVVAAVKEFDDAGARPRLRGAFADDLGGRVEGVALEHGMR